MEGLAERSDALIRSGARRLTGHQRRLFIAEVTVELCGGSARRAVRCLENFAARGRVRSEAKDARLAADIRAIVEPHAYADPELKSSRRYSNLSAAEVRQALIKAGHAAADLPAERTMRDILNRMNYRL